MKPFYFALITALIWGIVPIIEKLGLVKISPESGLLIRSLGVIVGAICFLGVIFGLIYKVIRSRGILRRKLLILTLGFILYVPGLLIEVIIYPGYALILIRTAGFLCAICWYLGLREEPEKVEKLPSEKKVKVKEALFRIAQRPEHLTEEEVSISKEKKICLACKGKVGGFNFICTECGAFYCEKCVRALIELENACWVCNTPFDELRPSKPFKREEEPIVVDDPEIIKKKQRRN